MNSLLKVAAVDQARKLRQGFGSRVIKMSGNLICFLPVSLLLRFFFVEACFGSLFF